MSVQKLDVSRRQAYVIDAAASPTNDRLHKIQGETIFTT